MRKLFLYQLQILYLELVVHLWRFGVKLRKQCEYILGCFLELPYKVLLESKIPSIAARIITIYAPSGIGKAAEP